MEDFNGGLMKRFAFFISAEKIKKSFEETKESLEQTSMECRKNINDLLKNKFEDDDTTRQLKIISMEIYLEMDRACKNNISKCDEAIKLINEKTSFNY